MNLPFNASGEGLGVSLDLADGTTTSSYVISSGQFVGYQGFIEFSSEVPISGARFFPLVASSGDGGTRFGFDDVLLYVPEPASAGGFALVATRATLTNEMRLA